MFQSDGDAWTDVAGTYVLFKFRLTSCYLGFKYQSRICSPFQYNTALNFAVYS